MFDIGFFELFVVIVIGLFVVGPERLPGTIKTCALWIGRIRHTLRETREDFEKHIGADEIRRELHNEQVLRSLEALKRSKADLIATANESANSILNAQEEQDLPDAYPHDDNGLAITTPVEDSSQIDDAHHDTETNTGATPSPTLAPTINSSAAANTTTNTPAESDNTTNSEPNASIK